MINICFIKKKNLSKKSVILNQQGSFPLLISYGHQGLTFQAISMPPFALLPNPHLNLVILKACL